MINRVSNRPRIQLFVALAIVVMFALPGFVAGPAAASPAWDSHGQSVQVNYAGAPQTAAARAAIQALSARLDPASLDLGGNGQVTIGVTNVTGRDFPYVKMEVWSRDDRNNSNPRLWVYFDDTRGQAGLVEVPVAPNGTRRTWDDWRMTAAYNPLRLTTASLGLPFARFDPRSPTDIDAIAQQRIQWQTLPAAQRTEIAAIVLSKPLLELDPNQVEAIIDRGGLDELEEQGAVRLLRNASGAPAFILATTGQYSLTAEMVDALANGWEFLIDTDRALVDTMIGTWKSVAVGNGTLSKFGENDVRATGSLLISDLGVTYLNGRRVFTPGDDIDPAYEAALRLVCESRQIDDQRYWGVAEGEEAWRLLRPDAYAETIEGDANGYVNAVVDRWHLYKKIPSDLHANLKAAVGTVCPIR